jgi:hypothetical protein
LAVAIAVALFGVVALKKSKPKMPAGDTDTVKVINWRQADLVEFQAVERGSACSLEESARRAESRPMELG